jgi:hypothetical protein
MNDRRGGRRCYASAVEASGIGGGYLVLLSVERIAQGELNASFGTREREALGIVG